MGRDLDIVFSGEDAGDEYVKVPVKRKDFGDFVLNLLGQQEKIEERRVGVFEVRFDWLVHLHHLLDQRIRHQASADLVDFSAVFKYSDGPERKVTDVGSFLHFNEAKLVTTESVRLAWTYLVSFPGKSVPEKQEVVVRFIKDKAEFVTIGGSSMVRHVTSDKGIASYSVSHTERTWGDDISALLAREVNSVFKDDPWYVSIIDRSAIFVALGMFAAGLIVPEYLDSLIKEQEAAKIFASIVPEGGTVDGLGADDKLSLIIKLLDPDNKINSADPWYRVASFVTGVCLAAFTLFVFERGGAFIHCCYW